MGDVGVDEPLPRQDEDDVSCGETSPQCAPSFRVWFDNTTAGSGDDLFRGVGAFRSPSEIIVSLTRPLGEATLGELSAAFHSRVSRCLPALAQRTVEAFFVAPEGCDLPPTGPGRDCGLLLRLDACGNRDDTLDNFFTPLFAGGLKVYNAIAHWSSKGQGDAVSNCRPAADQSKRRSKDESGDFTPVKRVKHTTLPEPVIYPFTQRCAYVNLRPRSISSNGSDCLLGDNADARGAVVLSLAVKKKDARMARRAFESEEQTARALLMAEERVARGEVNDRGKEALRQTVALLRLMDEDVPACGAKLSPLFKPAQRYPVDTEPLATFSSSEYKEKLANRAEETAWISHIFATTLTSGAALAAVKQKRKAMRESAREDGENSGDVEEDKNLVIGVSGPIEDLLLHYADVRRDLLTWERKTFQTLTKEMRLILEKQKQLDELILREAFHEELERAPVFDFDSYAHHYGQCFELGERGDAPETLPGLIADEQKNSSVRTSRLHVWPFQPPQRTAEPKEKKAEERAEEREKEGEGAVGAPEVLDSVMSSLLALPAPRTPEALLADDENLRRALEESRARAKAALDTIALIEMRLQDPVTFKLARHRLAFDEKATRNAIVTEEEDSWKQLIQEVRQEILDRERSELLAYMRLIDPVVKAEEELRGTIDQQHERGLSLLLCLFRCGMEQLVAV